MRVKWPAWLFGPRETPNERWRRICENPYENLMPLRPVRRGKLLGIGMQRINGQ